MATDYLGEFLNSVAVSNPEALDKGAALSNQLECEIKALIKQRDLLYDLLNYYAHRQGKVLVRGPKGLVIAPPDILERPYALGEDDKEENSH